MIRRHCVMVDKQPTSVSLEDAFWDALKRIAAARSTSLNALVSEVRRSTSGNLSSELRVYALRYSGSVSETSSLSQNRGHESNDAGATS